MATNNNLQDFLTDIANAIRTKTQTTEPINAQNFSTEILNIQTGGGGNTLKNLLDATKKVAYLFNNYKGTSVDNLIAYNDTENVVVAEHMFTDCTNLLSIPLFDTSNFQNIEQMFNGCNIKDARNLILPATTLSNECYNGMFYECRMLTNAPALTATTLTNSCYANMFYGCESLTQAPVLPATTLAEYCYDGMFQGCTSLTNAPILYATVPVTGCYNGMFRDCTSLDTINCQLSYLIDTATTGWVTNVQTNSGDFTFNCLNEEWTTGNDGIPTNWTSQCE